MDTSLNILEFIEGEKPLDVNDDIDGELGGQELANVLDGGDIRPVDSLTESLTEPLNTPLTDPLTDQSFEGGKPKKEGLKGDLKDDSIKNLIDDSIKDLIDDSMDSIDESLTPEDLYSYILAEIKRRGLAGHHLESMNTFYKVGIKQIATKVFVVEGRLKNKRDKTDEDREISDIAFKIEFTDINLTPPTITKYKSGTPQICTPSMARTRNLTYSAKMEIDAKITATAFYKNGTQKVRTAEFKNYRIASIPCQVRTELCHTHNCSKATLQEMEEDPTDPGGYFIVNGSEWTIDCLENTANNTFHVHKNMYMNEIVRGNFLSKPGDAFENSYQIILRYLNNGAITLELNTAKSDKFEIPFYILFRAMGMTSDRDIVDNIVYGVNNTDVTTKQLLQILEKAFLVEDPKFVGVKNSLNPNEIITYLGMKLAEGANTAAARKDDNIAKHLNANVLMIFDRYLFPHISTQPTDRIKKLRFLGHLINKLLCVNIGVLDPTDRDSYKGKRVHAAGTSMAKTFKTFFNIVAATESKTRLIRDFTAVPFSTVDLADSVKAAINSDDLEKMLTQAITSGSNTITVRHNQISNRLSSQTVNHKNDLNVKSTLNTINTPDTSASKSNDRADEMRRVHPTYLGFIDISQSADTGPKVGMGKQKACTASVSGATSSAVLRATLLADKELMPLDNVPPAMISARKLAKVFVNGYWIGCCENAYAFVYKYRMMRRRGEIHHLTTIAIEVLIREVYFWTDVGRLHRPLIIVYNNLEEYTKSILNGNVNGNLSGKPVKFKQWIKLRKEHITGLQNGTISMDDLLKAQIIEYITPEEQESTFIAPNIDELRAHVNDHLYQFTHMDIDQAVFGVVSLAAPLANHSLPVRITMYTNHRKQSAAWFALNWPYRIDKNATYQWYCERPLISTFSDSLTLPNGHNTIVAITLYEGFGQEDSIVANKDSIDCGLFNASFFNYERTELEKGEQFGNNLEEARTLEIKREAIYEFVEDGFVKKDTLLKPGYVMIVKSAKLPKPIENYLYVDKSIIYNREEEARVSRVVVTRNSEEVPLAKVQWRANRPVIVGDKFCLTDDHFVHTEAGLLAISKVTTDTKILGIDQLMNTHTYYNPSEVFGYRHNELVVTIKNAFIDQTTTLNHKFYACIIKDDSKITVPINYRWYQASELAFKRAYFWSPEGPIIVEPSDYTVHQYKGIVYCITLPMHLFKVHRNGVSSWTGNSSRTGNKGICARQVPRIDMPYCEDGTVPDLIVNAHSIPTRMAINQIIECVLGQLAAKKGCHIDGTSFKKIDIDGAIKELERDGIKYGGHRRMYNGRTGCWIDSLIFIGPTTYQRLQKFILDENYANQSGPTSALTHQPTDGKVNNGGLRLGEMELWVLNAQGIMRSIKEKIYKDSDGVTIYICRNCQQRAICNEKLGIYKCKTCKGMADIAQVQSSWVANLWFNESAAMNVKMNFELDPLRKTITE